MDGIGHQDSQPVLQDAPHRRWPGLRVWLAGAGVCAALALVAASSIVVDAGSAALVTQFGRPVRVIAAPGLAWKLPAPLQMAVAVDCRLHVTATDLTGATTRDGQRLMLQAFVAWQVVPEPDTVRRFVRAVRNDPAEAGRQLRSLAASTLQAAAAGFDMAALINADPSKAHLQALETRMQGLLAAQARATYGIAVQAVGIERVSLPPASLAAAIARMRDERLSVANATAAEGERQAAQIRADASRDSRIMMAEAQTQAAGIEAESRRQAADIQARAYSADPQLYTMLRSLDTLGGMIGPNTRLVLRTDAAPFNVLVQGPPAPESGADAPTR